MLPALLVAVIFGWHIEKFSSFGILGKKGDLRITEYITVNFGNELYHGIYRTLPVVYQKTGPLDFKFLTAKLDDKPVKVKIIRRNDYLTIRIGDPGKRISGTHTYSIFYSMRNVVFNDSTSQKLIWNVTGNDWIVPIKEASFTFKVEVPNVSLLNLKCFTGRYGSIESECSIDKINEHVEFHTNGPLRPNEGFTVYMEFPPGTIEMPSNLTKFWWRAKRYKLFLLPLITFVLMFGLWCNKGREQYRGPDVPTYHPPKDLNPAEAGAIYDEKVDPSDITGLLIDLSFRGYIKILEYADKEYVIIKARDWGTDKTLKLHERYLLDSLFSVGDYKTRLSLSEADVGEIITTSSLKNKFYRKFRELKKMILGELTSRGYFVNNPETVRKKYTLIGVLLLVSSFFLFHLFYLFYGRTSAFVGIVSIELTGIIVIVFGRMMPRRTRKGAAVLQRIRGFHDFIKRAEKDRIRRLAEDEPELFKDILPYAIAFREEGKWNEVFNELYEKFEGMGFTYVRVSSFTHFNSVVGSHLTSSPRGGGSGFGGGGFSGGGAGGGGGGAW